MAPDLPYTGDGVPDGSEAPRSTGRFAELTRISRGLARAVARNWRYALAASLITGLGLGVAVPMAQADDLTDRKKQVSAQLNQTRKDLDESTKGLSDAVVALQQAEASLSDAQATLAKTRTDLAAATKADTAAAAKLKAQQAELAKAKAAVIAGQKKVDDQKRLVALMVSDSYQKRTNLLPMAILTESSSMSDLQSRVQMSTTMLDTSQSKFETLTALQRELVANKAKQAALEKQVAADRAAAAKVLATKKALEQQAATQAASVAALVNQRASAKAAASREVAADKKRYASLESERASVQHRIAERIARAKAKAAAEQRAREAAARKAAAAARAKSTSHKSTSHKSASHSNSSHKSSSHKPKSHSSGSSGSSAPRGSSAHHGFIYPVNGPITSPFGMRFHPVLHVWKLHDGTDFGAGCGTPIHAAYSGTVEERYFNAGYGNRMIIDHGKVDGRYVSTAYNHATRYIVGVGQHVRQGQTIGYVGQTGYATGCHMHLMVYLDGSMVNPMSWY